MADSFSDHTAALRTRDAIEQIVRKILNTERPAYEYGTVTAINRATNTCDVQFAGSTTSVTVYMGSIQPQAVGQTVRVDGYMGDRFVSDVIGAAVTTSYGDDDLVAPTLTVTSQTGSPGTMLVEWGSVEGATEYEINIAADAAFTISNRVYTRSGGSMTVAVGPGTWYTRVRAVTEAGASPWSPTRVNTVSSFPGGSDGNPPQDSPDVTVSEGLGMLQADWTPVVNDDLVVYEVYIDTTSGFTPSASTKLGETTGSFWITNIDATGTPLSYATTYYIRVIARDADGAATAGAQGSGTPRQVDTGDAGSIAIDGISDGNVPPAVAAAPTMKVGIGYLMASWAFVTNDDPVMYEVHISDTTGFTPTAGTLVGETPSNFAFIRKLGTDDLEAELTYGTTYYVKIFAKDADGYASSASPQASTSTVQAGTSDFEELSVTEAIIANLAVAEGKIANLAVTNGKIALLAVDTAQIQDLAVATGKIDDLAVTTAKIGNLQVTDAKIDTMTANKLTAGTIDASVITVTNLNASNINTGTLDASVVTVSNLNASNINTGTLDASVVTVSNLNATNITTGSLSGATIDIGGADTTSFHVDATGQIWSGAAAFADGPFRVTAGGSVTAESITIEGGSISGTSIDIGGTDATSWHVDSGGNMWSGNGTYAGAPFQVSNAGAVTATDVTLTGTLVTNSSGTRIDVGGTANENIQFYGSTGTAELEVTYSLAGGTRLDMRSTTASSTEPATQPYGYMYVRGQGDVAFGSNAGATMGAVDTTYGDAFITVNRGFTYVSTDLQIEDNLYFGARATAGTKSNDYISFDDTNNKYVFNIDGSDEGSITLNGDSVYYGHNNHNPSTIGFRITNAGLTVVNTASATTGYLRENNATAFSWTYSTASDIRAAVTSVTNDVDIVQVNSSDQLGYPTSSAAFKRNIETSDFFEIDMMNVRPVRYIYDKDKFPAEMHTEDWENDGFIVEELAAVSPKLAKWRYQNKSVHIHPRDLDPSDPAYDPDDDTTVVGFTEPSDPIPQQPKLDAIVARLVGHIQALTLEVDDLKREANTAGWAINRPLRDLTP